MAEAWKIIMKKNHADTVQVKRFRYALCSIHLCFHKKKTCKKRSWHGYFFQIGWSEYFKKSWSRGIFTHNSLRVYTEYLGKQKHPGCRQSAGCNTFAERDQRRMRRQEVYSNSNKHSVQPWWAEKHLRCSEDQIMRLINEQVSNRCSY